MHTYTLLARTTTIVTVNSPMRLDGKVVSLARDSSSDVRKHWTGSRKSNSMLDIRETSRKHNRVEESPRRKTKPCWTAIAAGWSGHGAGTEYILSISLC